MCPMTLSSEQAKKMRQLGGGRKAGPLSGIRKLEIAKKKVMEKLIYKKTAPLIRAGMISAMGQTFVYRIDEERDSKNKLLSRKHVLVEDAGEIADALDRMEEGGQDPEDKFYYVTAKEPDVRAIEMLLNRGYGKPKETIDLNAEVQFSLKHLAKMREDIQDQPLEVPNEVIIEPENIIDVKSKNR